MLKIIGILSSILLSSNAFSHEFEVIISDELTGEIVVEKCANELEVNDVTKQVRNLNDESVKFFVNRIKMPVGLMGVKRGGGEGGGD